MMKQKNMYYCSICVIVVFFCSCSHFPAFMGSDPPPAVKAPPKEESPQGNVAAHAAAVQPAHPVAKPAVVEKKPPRGESAEELDLKVTRLWARVDELEQTISLQEQRIFLLQKGLMTGVVPDELLQMDGRPAPKVFAPVAEHKEEKAPKNGQKTPGSNVDQGKKTQPAKDVVEHDPHASQAKANLNEEQQKEYQKRLVEAQAAFDAQQYGNAIILFEKLGTEYADGVTGGNHVYWTGLCWFYLKDYDAARKNFTRFTASYKTHPLVPKALYYLAKTEYSAGFTETSIKRLNDIIKEYPNDEISATARLEIKKIEEKL